MSCDYLGENEESNIIDNTAEIYCASSEESGDDGFEEPLTDQKESEIAPLNHSFIKETGTPEG